MTDEQAAEAFCAIRWRETGGKPVCPECEGMNHYDLKSRPVWKCKGCSKQFSMTSGTVFHSRKLKLRDILGAIAIFTNGAKGYSALQLSRDLGCDYKTSFVLLHKVRESIQLARNEGALQGDVELDGAYFGGHVRPENRKEDRKDRRLAENQTGKRQVVVVARERQGRTITTVAKSEAAGVAFARKSIATGSTVHADEASHWDQLAANFPIKRVNHQIEYSAADGACTNQAESFFSAASAALKSASITTLQAGISKPMRLRWLGAKITAVRQTGTSLPCSSALPLPRPNLNNGAVTGNVTQRSKPYEL